MNTFKSITANFSMEKAIKALEAYNIELFETNDQGMKMLRSGTNIFLELMKYMDTLDDDGKRRLAENISGGKYQINAMMAFLEDRANMFSKIMEKIANNSSDAMTEALLKMGLEPWKVKLMQLQASFQVFSKTLGEDLLPALKKVAEGLTYGLFWLSENKEAVSALISAFVSFGQALILYRGLQLAASIATERTTIAIRALYLLEGNFKAAFAGMGAAVTGFARTVAMASLQLGALYVAMNVISAMYERFSDKTGLVGQKQDLEGQIAALKGSRAAAMAQASRAGFSPEQVSATIDAQIAEKEAKLAEVNKKIEENKKRESDAIYERVKKEYEEAFKSILGKDLFGEETPTTPTMTDQIGRGAGGRGGGPSEPRSEQFFVRLEAQRLYNELMTQSKIAADQYEQSIASLNAEEERRGVTTDLNIRRLQTMSARQKELWQEAEKADDLAKTFENNANVLISKNSEIKKILDEQRKSWESLTNEEKREFIEAHREYVQDFELLVKLLNLSDQLRAKVADLRKEAEKTGADIARVDAQKSKELYERTMRELGYDKEYHISKLDRFGGVETEFQQRNIELYYTQQQLAYAKAKLETLDKTTEEYKRQRVEVEKLTLQVEELKDRYEGVRKFWADSIIDMAENGTKFKDIMKRIWQDIAREAIYQIFRVKSQSSILSQMSTKGKSTNFTPPPAPNDALAYWSTPYDLQLPRMHSGGIVGHQVYPKLNNGEVMKVLQTGEEVNSRQDRRSIEVMGEVAKAALESQKNTSSQPIVIYAMDAQSVAEFFDRNGDVMAAVLRKQGNLNNRL